MGFEIRNKVTMEDYLAFNKWYNRKSTLFFIVFHAVLFLISAVIIGDYSVFMLSVLFFIYFLLYLFVTLSSKYYLLFKSKKIYSSDLGLQAERVLCINEDIIIEESEYATVQMKWDVLHKVIEYKGNIYLLLSKNKGIIIQKNDISEELRAFIMSRSDNL